MARGKRLSHTIVLFSAKPLALLFKSQWVTSLSGRVGVIQMENKTENKATKMATRKYGENFIKIKSRGRIKTFCNG
jgi:hypothetical protein